MKRHSTQSEKGGKSSGKALASFPKASQKFAIYILAHQKGKMLKRAGGERTKLQLMA